jgi:signal peptidase I
MQLIMSDAAMHNESSSDTASRSDRSLVAYTIVALGVALFIRFFVAAPFVVSGTSMEPNFEDWHYLIVDRLTYVFSEPQRGDVVVLDLPQDTHRSLIKRMVGLPGDTIVLAGAKVEIFNAQHPEGFILTEPYLDPNNLGGPTNMRITLQKGEYFVLGDNRRVSADSRIWGILPKSDIVGRVFLRLYPFSEIGVLPGQARYDTNTPVSASSTTQ